MGKKQNGIVYLVGAGPGDPGLITAKGMECIRSADVIIYDYLAAPALLQHAGENAELIYVGKKGGDHTLSQEGINDLIVEKAREHAVVTRLKGGDPFIFGRGGEEAEVLLAAGIAFEVVPGVTSAIAAPAYAGIPLTHRRHTATVAFVTGHEDPTKPDSNIDWKSLAGGIGTLVFLMGVKNLPHIARHLIQNGKPATTPAAAIRWGTTAHQQTVSGTLADIAERVSKAGLKAPAIVVVGEVVQLRENLQWFEKRPLLGKNIIVTRARAQASDLIRRLSDLGAQCHEFPTIRVVAPDDWQPLDKALNRLADYQWLIFTSVNGVRYFFERLFALDKDVRALHHIKTAAIGPVTAAELLARGLKTDILPETYRAESVVEAFKSAPLQNSRVLLPRAEEARPILPDELKKMGAQVDEITVYRTIPVTESSGHLIEALQATSIDMVTFTSSSTVRNFRSLLPDDRFQELMRSVAVASIGPITSDTASELGFTVDVTAESFTIPGLVEAIIGHFAA